MTALLTLSLLGWAHAGSGDTEVGGYVEFDARARVSDVAAGPWYAPVGVAAGVERVEGIVGANLRSQGDAWVTEFAGRLRARGATEATDLPSLSDRSAVSPVIIEVEQATIELWDAGLKGLDFRMGHQLVQWGVGDQFNPTNNLNSDDLQDPLRFGKQLPNAMLRADYIVGPTWTLSGVLVPLFRPASLPATSAIGTSFTDRIPVVEDAVRRELQSAQALARDGLRTPTIVSGTSLQLPGATSDNVQWMVRAGGAVGMHDVALSWYTGRSDIPQAVRNYTTRVESPLCHPVRTDDCIAGYLLTEAELAYPRMHVAGLNAAGEANLLGFLGAEPLGWRFEAAWVMPQRLTIAVENAELALSEGLVQPAGEFDYGLDGERPTVVEGRPFAKWTLGLDYTLGKGVYINAQWVHGLADEFGAGDFIQPGFVTRAGDADWEIRRLRIGDYMVVGSDIGLGGPTLRIFTLLDLTGYQTERAQEGRQDWAITKHGPLSPKGFSAVLFPELMFNAGHGLSMGVGAVILLGEEHTKFGDPAAGGNLAFVRAVHTL
jgi:hypothetical protein